MLFFDTFSLQINLMWLDSTFLAHTHLEKSLSEFNFNKKLLNEKPGEIASHKITPTS